MLIFHFSVWQSEKPHKKAMFTTIQHAPTGNRFCLSKNLSEGLALINNSVVRNVFL